MARVLVVDDDGHIREVVRFALERAGYAVEEAADGASALDRFAARPPDVLVLDINLPDLDGIEICRRARAGSEVPILFLTCRDEELDRVLGLEIGADDYVTKPFSPRELAARVKALLRRAGAGGSPPQTPAATLRQGPLSLDPERHRCHYGDAEITLTVTEFELLQALMAAPGKVFTRGDLVERAWGRGHHITERTIDSHIRRLRRKFADLPRDPPVDPIETVYGLGYRLHVDGG